MNTKLLIGLLGLILCFTGQSCQKDDHQKIGPQIIEHCDDADCGNRAGIAPFLNLSVLALDSTQVTGTQSQITFNGAKIATIQATATNEQPGFYLNVLYNHYSNCTVTFTDGTKWIHNKPIYISHPISGNLILSGPLTGWSLMSATHPDNLVRYTRTAIYKMDWLRLRGENWRVYTYLVNGRRIEMHPTLSAYRTFRFF
jgi:hypothetical protein